MNVHALLTEHGGHGGIQRYNRQLVRALEQLVSRSGGRLNIFSLNDAGQSGEVQGFQRSRGRFIRAALHTAREQRPDAVIVGHVNFASLIPLYRSLSPRTRTYVVTHGKEVEVSLARAEALGLRLATGVLAVSESTRSLVVSRQAVPVDRVHLLHYGSTGGGDEPRRGAHLPTGSSSRLLSVARLNKGDAYKGIDTTLRALPALCERFPRLEYWVVGDGDDLPRLRTLANELGVSHLVEFTGSVSEAELGERYETCDIFVLPSTHEGLGIVYLEAMAHRKPVVAAHAGGVADAVVHEVNGLLVDHVTPQSVAATIARLLLDPQLRNRLGAWGHQYTVPRFSFQRMLIQLGNVLIEDRVPGNVSRFPERAVKTSKECSPAVTRRTP